MTVKAALWKVLDAMPARDISGWDLFDIVAPKTERATYPTTLIDYAKEYADMSGGEFRCVDRQESRYRFVPGFRMGGAIVDRKER